MEIDSARGVVTVGAGVRYGALATHLHAAGYALRNLAPLPHGRGGDRYARVGRPHPEPLGGRVRDRVAAVAQVCEVRTAVADDLWLSPSYRRDSVAMHFTWVNDAKAVTPVVAAVEERLAPFHARPHWGKVFTTSPETVWGLYERAPDFVDLLKRLDPGGKFRNELIDRYFPG